MAELCPSHTIFRKTTISHAVGNLIGITANERTRKKNEHTNNFTSRQVLFHNELHVHDFHLIATWTKFEQIFYNNLLLYRLSFRIRSLVSERVHLRECMWVRLCVRVYIVCLFIQEIYGESLKMANVRQKENGDNNHIQHAFNKERCTSTWHTHSK